MAFILRVDGTTEEIKNTKLETLQEAVGGLIQIVTTEKGQDIVVDEEGKLKNKPVNEMATQLWRDSLIESMVDSKFDSDSVNVCFGNWMEVIVGDVVIAEAGEIK